jgi:hypothetical protein
MNKAAKIALVCGLLSAADGCGDSHESLVKEGVRILNDAADVLSTINDKAGVDAARPKLRDINQRWRENQDRADAMKKPTQQERQRLQREYSTEFETAGRRCRIEKTRVRRVPGGAAAIKELDDIKPDQWLLMNVVSP